MIFLLGALGFSSVDIPNVHFSMKESYFESMPENIRLMCDSNGNFSVLDGINNEKSIQQYDIRGILFTLDAEQRLELCKNENIRFLVKQYDNGEFFLETYVALLGGMQNSRFSTSTNGGHYTNSNGNTGSSYASCGVRYGTDNTSVGASTGVGASWDKYGNSGVGRTDTKVDVQHTDTKRDITYEVSTQIRKEEPINFNVGITKRY